MTARVLVGLGALTVALSTLLIWLAYEGPGIRGGVAVDDLRLDSTIWRTRAAVTDLAIVVSTGLAVVAAVLGHRRALLHAGSAALFPVPLLAVLLVGDGWRGTDARGAQLAAVGLAAIVAGLVLLIRGDEARLEGARRHAAFASPVVVALVGLAPYALGVSWLEGPREARVVVLAAAVALAVSAGLRRAAVACALGTALAATSVVTGAETLATEPDPAVGAWLFILVVAPLAAFAASGPRQSPKARTSASTTRSPARPSP